MAEDGGTVSREFLDQQLVLANKAAGVLKYSYQQVEGLTPLGEDMPDEVLAQLDALTSRFARLSDLMLQKVWRAVDALEFVDEGSLLDRIHRADVRVMP